MLPDNQWIHSGQDPQNMCHSNNVHLLRQAKGDDYRELAKPNGNRNPNTRLMKIARIINYLKIKSVMKIEWIFECLQVASYARTDSSTYVAYEEDVLGE